MACIGSVSVNVSPSFQVRWIVAKVLATGCGVSNAALKVALSAQPGMRRCTGKSASLTPSPRLTEKYSLSVNG